MSSGFLHFLQFKSEFGNKEFMIWATVTSRSCFCWLYRASPSLAAKDIINLTSVLTIWWCPCVESTLVLLQEGVWYDIVFSWQNSVSHQSRDNKNELFIGLREHYCQLKILHSAVVQEWGEKLLSQDEGLCAAHRESLWRMISGGNLTEKIIVGWQAVSDLSQRNWCSDG